MLRLEGRFSQAKTILLEADELFRKNPRINEDPGMNYPRV
jgi:Flp pilus assembly protein TadD